MNKSVALIQSYCDTPEKKRVLFETVDTLQRLGIDTVVTSPVLIDKLIYEKSNYYVYHRDNPLQWEDICMVYWKLVNGIKLRTAIPEYGWAVFHQMKIGYELIKNKGYDHIFVACYDLEINDLVRETIQSRREGYFSHLFTEPTDTAYFNVTPNFISLSAESADTLISGFDAKDYISHPEEIAEAYLERRIKPLNLSRLGEVTDRIRYVKNLYDYSPDERFTIFVDSENHLGFYYENKDDIAHQAVVNDILIDLPVNYYFHKDINLEDIKRFGVFIENEFINLTHLLKPEYRINTIEKIS